jgi:hemerythrin-like domain-containing protein
MEAYLNKSIKEVIKEFPPVEKILDEYGIGCGPCAVGLCLLKDIVSIHNLPAEEEQQMMARITGVIHPGQKIQIPRLEKKAEVKREGIKYSPPMKKLVEEHVLIKKWLALIPDILPTLDLEAEEDRRLVLVGVDFIRSYADQFHHAKEEDILFKYFDENLDMVKVMCEDHKTARNHVKAIVEAVERKDRETVVQRLNSYRNLLSQHIKREDEIMLPWMDKQLSVSQVGEMFSNFLEAEDRMDSYQQKYEEFISRVEKKYKRLSSGNPASPGGKESGGEGVK